MLLDMKKAILSSVVWLAVFTTLRLFGENPIIQTKFTADPAPFVSGDTLYLITSHDEDDAIGFKMYNWLCYSTKDMVNWTEHGIIAGVREPYRTFKWADGVNAWAPHCIERNGKFYLYCPVQYRGRMTAIGVAVADHPAGPYVDPLGKPLIFRDRDGDYDPAVFIDDDGQAYLYWGGNGPCFCIKLNEDMISTSGEIQQMHIDFTGAPPEAAYTEGPWVWKRNNRYYMAWASRCCPEGIAYAISDSPTGPWKCMGLIMDPSPLSDGNHPGIVEYKGKWYVFGLNYELWFAIQGNRRKLERRSVCVAEMTYNEDGTIKKVPWWGKGAPVPSVPQIEPLNPYAKNEGETICWSEGIKSDQDANRRVFVFPVRERAFIKVAGVDFGSIGASTFTATFASETKPGIVQSGAIELHLGSVDGPIIGVLPIDFTDGAWKTKTIPISGATGVHDLFFVFKGSGLVRLCKFDAWQFAPKRVPATLVGISTALERYKIDAAPGPANKTQVRVLAVYSDGSSKDVTGNAKFEVENPQVAVVQDGVVLGKAPGQTRIKASYNDKSEDLIVIVGELKKELTASKLLLNASRVMVHAGDTWPISAIVEFQDGHQEDATPYLEYEVENPKIATVTNGVLVGLEAGTTTIKVKYRDSLGNTIAAPLRVAATFRSAFEKNEAETFTADEGILTENCAEGGKNIGFIQNGDWVMYAGVDFGNGASAIEFRVASATEGGTIEIRLDRPDGPLIGTCKVENTGGWQSWVTQTAKVEKVTGRHDLYLKFTGGPGYLLNLNWWRFLE